MVGERNGGPQGERTQEAGTAMTPTIVARGGKLGGKVTFLAGATSGIGRRTAELFADEGAHVITGRRRRNEGLAVSDSITSRGGSISRWMSPMRSPFQTRCNAV